MASLTSQLILTLIDKISGPARGAAASLKGVSDAQKRLAGQKFKWGDDFQRAVEQAKLTRAQVKQLAADYERLQNMTRGRRASFALGAMEDWHRGTLAGLKAVGREQEAILARQERMNRGLRGGMRMALGAFGVGGTAFAARRVGGNAMRANAVSAREDARDYLAGLSPEETSTLRRSALSSSSRYNSVDASTMHERLRDTSMSMRSVDKALQLSDTIAQGTAVLQSLKGKDAAIEEGRKFFTALDVLGKNIDPKEVRGLFDGYIKALGVEGADMDLGGVLQMSRRLKSAGSTVSNRFLMTTGVGLGRDMGDERAGNAIAMMNQQEVQATKQAKAFGQKYGLRDKSGKFVDRSLLQSDPDQWAWKNITDAMKRAKMDPNKPGDVNTFLQSAYSNSSARDVLSKIMTQREQYQGKGVQFDKGPGLDAADKLPKMDPFVAYEGLFAQLRNLATQAPIMDAAAKSLDYLSSSIAGFTESFAKGDTSDKIGKALGVGSLGILGGTLGVMGAKGAYQWFTGGAALSGSAIALNASAAALSAAAAQLGGGAAAGKVAGAATGAAATAGGAAAGGAAASGTSIWSKIGTGAKTVLPMAGKAAAPVAIIAGGVALGHYLSPDDEASAASRRARGKRVRDAMLERRREEDARLGIDRSEGSDGAKDIWKSGAQAIQGLENLKGPAGSAGAQTGSSFRTNLKSELDAAVSDVEQAAAKMRGMLNFSVTPSITPRINLPAAPGRSASVDATAARHAAFADTGVA